MNAGALCSKINWWAYFCTHTNTENIMYYFSSCLSFISFLCLFSSIFFWVLWNVVTNPLSPQQSTKQHVQVSYHLYVYVPPPLQCTFCWCKMRQPLCNYQSDTFQKNNGELTITDCLLPVLWSVVKVKCLSWSGHIRVILRKDWTLKRKNKVVCLGSEANEVVISKFHCPRTWRSTFVSDIYWRYTTTNKIFLYTANSRLSVCVLSCLLIIRSEFVYF